MIEGIKRLLKRNKNLVTTEDINIINKEEDSTLEDWWIDLNCWEWPEKLPNECKTHLQEGSEYIYSSRRSQLRDFIEYRIGHRRISRKWNKDMTAEEFNNFYLGTYLGDKEAKKRYEDSISNKVRGIKLEITTSEKVC
jgi:hypothetical protein